MDTCTCTYMYDIEIFHIYINMHHFPKLPLLEARPKRVKNLRSNFALVGIDHKSKTSGPFGFSGRLGESPLDPDRKVES